MTLALHDIHDASLVAVRFDWPTRTCHFDFSGAPQITHPFTVTFTGVTELVISAVVPWGHSVSVLEVKVSGAGRYEFAMQSGDTITVVAPNNSLMPTPQRGSA